MKKIIIKIKDLPAIAFICMMLPIVGLVWLWEKFENIKLFEFKHK